MDFKFDVRSVSAPEGWYEESWRNRYYVRHSLRRALSKWDNWGKGFEKWMQDFGRT